MDSRNGWGLSIPMRLEPFPSSPRGTMLNDPSVSMTTAYTFSRASSPLPSEPLPAFRLRSCVHSRGPPAGIYLHKPALVAQLRDRSWRSLYVLSDDVCSLGALMKYLSHGSSSDNGSDHHKGPAHPVRVRPKRMPPVPIQHGGGGIMVLRHDGRFLFIPPVRLSVECGLKGSAFSIGAMTSRP